LGKRTIYGRALSNVTNNNMIVGPNNQLYLVKHHSHKIMKINEQGLLETVAGNGSGYDPTEDGVPAVETTVTYPKGITFDKRGNLYISVKYVMQPDGSSPAGIRKVGPDGIITTVSTDYVLEDIFGDVPNFPDSYDWVELAALPNGDLLVAKDHRIFAVTPMQSMVDDGLIYEFDAAGRHLRTLDQFTGVVLKEFEYGLHNQLTAVVDEYGNRTSLQLDGRGLPVSITSPDGQTTSLLFDGNGHLTRVTRPDGSYYSYQYDAQGLMTAKTGPNGHTIQYAYDDGGPLVDRDRKRVAGRRIPIRRRRPAGAGIQRPQRRGPVLRLFHRRPPPDRRDGPV
jgi:YD repeat-containing protein